MVLLERMNILLCPELDWDIHYYLSLILGTQAAFKIELGGKYQLDFEIQDSNYSE